MFVLPNNKVLVVGFEEAVKMLQPMPFAVYYHHKAATAARSFKTEEYHSVVCNWQLEDMSPGRFLSKLHILRPHLPCIAVIEPESNSDEIAARSAGVFATVSRNVEQTHLCSLVCQSLGLQYSDAVTMLDAVWQ